MTLVRMVDEGSKVGTAVGTLIKQRPKDAPVVIETGTSLWRDKAGEIMDAALNEGVDPGVVVESEVRGGANVVAVHSEAVKYGVAVPVILQATMNAGVDASTAMASAMKAGIVRQQLQTAALAIGMEPGDVVAALLSTEGDVKTVVKEMIELRPDSANDVLMAALIVRPSAREGLAEIFADSENAPNLTAVFAVSNLVGKTDESDKDDQNNEHAREENQSRGKGLARQGAAPRAGAGAGTPQPALSPKLLPTGGSGGGETASPS